jgi:ribosomal-protein-alanine N-acetyltransferase
LTIAPATAEDAEALARVHALAFAAPWSAPDIAAMARGHGAFALAARRLGDVAGFILCRTIVDEAEVLTLATAPAHRRQGLARRLLEAAALAAGHRGAARLFLEVAADNAAAIALYQDAGFGRAGVRAGYYSTPAGAVDALVMQRDLNSR